MAYQDQISSLALISEYLAEGLEEATASLERYHKQMEGSAALKHCMVKIHQTNRVFSFIELTGAEQLTKEVLRALRQLPEQYSVTDIDLLESMSFGLTLLVRYLDYIASKPFDLPQLLLVPINELRVAMNQAPFLESSLFKADHRKSRPNWERNKSIDDFERGKLSRRLRQMFQIGLIEVIRKTNVNGGLTMMNRALSRLDSQCGSPNSPNLWWIAQGANNGYLHGGLLLSPERFRFFTRLDLQMRAMGQVDHNLNYKNREEAEKLAFELLYLSSLSDASDDLTKEIKQHFQLQSTGLSERTLSHEFLLLKGLSETDYDTLYTTIADDVEQLQTELITGDYEENSADLHNLLLHVKQLYSLFTVLEFKKQEAALETAINRVSACIDKETRLLDDDRRFVSDALSDIESTLKGSSKGGADSYRSKLSRDKLSADQMEACVDARKHFQLIIKQLEHYANEGHNPELLESVPATLSRAAEDLERFESKPFQELVSELKLVFESHFTKQPATIQGLEMLADILCSIEFHLETKQQNHNPSEKIYAFADDNLAKLKSYLER